MKELLPHSQLEQTKTEALTRANLIESRSSVLFPPEIDTLLVLAGPGTFFEPLKTGEQEWQAFMDRDRIKTAVNVFNAIASSKKTQLPIFAYSGSPLENRDFLRALETEVISLPKDKVVIVGSVKNGKEVCHITNTRDNINGFYELAGNLGGPLRETHNVALISHSPHFIRIPHYIRKAEEGFLRDKGRIFSYWAYGVRSNPDVFEEFAKAELGRLEKYIASGHLANRPTIHMSIA